MANRNETATATVNFNGQNAGEELKKLETRAKELRREMTLLASANDKAGFDRAEKQYKTVVNEMKQLKNQAFDVKTVLNNLNKTNFNDLQRAQKQVSAELKKMERGTADYIAKNKELKLVSAEINKVKAEMSGLNAASGKGFWGKTADGINKFAGMAAVAVGSFTAVALGVKSSIEAYNQYEQKVSELSALTGLQGEELDWLSQKAKETSISTLENGIRITKSADDIVEAYKLMGSAKPELLKNKDALAEVTEKALILAAAASMETQPAVDGLAIAMNQFNAPANEAARYINVLAAGAKEGAAEVPDLTDSLVKSGTAANMAGINIEQTVASIEALAEKGIKGEIAGTGLKNVFLRLQQGADEFNPKVVGLSTALDNMANANMSAADMVKIFGQENFTAAKILIDNRKRVDELTTAVTGTQVAIEQAQKTTGTNAAAMEQAKNKFHLAALELGKNLAPAFTFSTNAASYLIKGILGLINVYKEHSRLINTAAATITAYTIATKVAKYWDDIHYAALVVKDGLLKAHSFTVGVLTGKINLATAATKLFSNAQKGTIWGLIAAGIAAAITYLLSYKEKLSEVSETQKVMNAFHKQYNERLTEESSKMNLYFNTLETEKLNKEQKLALIKKLNDEYGKYLPKLLTEKSSIEDIKNAQKFANEELAKNIALKIREEDITKLAQIKKGIDDEITGYKVYISVIDDFIKRTKDLSNKEKLIAETRDKNYAAAKKYAMDNDANIGIHGGNDPAKILEFYNNQITAANDKLKTNSAATKSITDEYNNIMKSLNNGIDTPPDNTENPAAPKPVGKSEKGKNDDSAKKALEQKFKELEKLSQDYTDFLYISNQQSADKEIEAIYIKYNRQLEAVGINEKLKNELINKVNTEGLENLNELEARQYDVIYKNQLAVNKEVNDKILSQDKEFNDAKKAFQEELEQMGMSEKDREIQAVSDKYEKLRLLNDKYYTDEETRQDNLKKLIQMEEAEKTAIVKKSQLDQVKAAEDAAEKIRQEEIKKFDGFKSGMSAISGVLGDLYSLISKKQGEATEEAKLFAYAQILIDTGVGIAGGISKVANSSGSWYEIIAGIALVAASIIGAMASATSFVDSAEVPSHYEGGKTGSGLGILDKDGNEVAGIVHKDEYVIPAWERKIPQIAAMESVIEAVRKKGSYATGGETTQVSGFRVGKKTGTGSEILNITGSYPAMINLLSEISKKLDNPTRAKVVYTELDNMNEKVNDWKTLYFNKNL